MWSNEYEESRTLAEEDVSIVDTSEWLMSKSNTDGSIIWLYGKVIFGRDDKVVIRMIDAYFNQNWSFVYYLTYTKYGFTVLPDDSSFFVFSTLFSQTRIYMFDGSSGVLLRARKILQNLFSQDNRVFADPDSTTVFFTAISMNELWKYDIKSDNVNCVEVDLASTIHNFLPISSIEAVISYKQTSGYSLYFAKLSIESSPQFGWTISTSCPGVGGWAVENSLAILDSTNTKIYALSAYDGTLQLYTLNKDTGEMVGTQYVSAQFPTTYTVFTLFEANHKLYMLFGDSIRYVLIYDINSNGFSNEYEIPSASIVINHIAYLNSDFVFFFGTKASPSLTFYTSRAYHTAIDSLLYVQDSSVVSMTPIGTNYALNSETNPSLLTFSSQNAYTISPPSPDFYYTLTGIITYYTSIWDNEHYEAHLLPFTFYTLNFTRTCQHRQSTTPVSQQLLGLSGDMVNWVIFDTAQGLVSLDKTPDAASPTTYTFKVKYSWVTEESYKTFFITVAPCQVTNCVKWNGFSNICGEWRAGYRLVNYQCEQFMSTTTRVVQRLSQTMLGIGVGASIVSAALTTTSPQGAFSMINQFQMLLLLPLIGAYIPLEVIYFIVGMDFALFSFDFIPYTEAPGISHLALFLNVDQRNEYLQTIGFKSESSLMNNMSILFTIILTILLHGVIYLCYRRVKDLSDPKWYHRLTTKTFEGFTLSVYIRMILEAFLFISISSFSEIKYSRLISVAFIISFLISWTLIVLSFGVITTIGYQIVKAHPNFDEQLHWKFRELFAGIKNDTFSRLFPLLFCLNRTFWVIIVVLLNEIILDAKTALFTALQFLFLWYLIAIRPFQSKKDMIIECTNQVILVVLSCLLIHFNKEPNWKSVVESIFIGMITLGVLVGIIVSIFDSIKTIFIKIKSYYEKTKKVTRVTADPSVTGMSRYLQSNTVVGSDITIPITQNEKNSIGGMVKAKTYDLSYSEVRPKYPKIS
jgi:hypothetical protein